MEVENRLSPNRLDSQVHAHMSRNLRAVEQLGDSLTPSR